MTNDIQRRFILGDEWVYFKLYSGPKTLESILIHEVYRVVTELFQSKVIDQFFFIRYTDPDYHLRVRFHLPHISGLNAVIGKLNSSLKYYMDNRLIWKVCADTYSREMESYGSLTMVQAEAIFGLDSLTIINFLKDTEENGNDPVRWLWGIKCMDIFLSQFGLTINDKVDFYGMLNDGYAREFQMNKPMQVQLDKKYRNEMNRIKQIIDQPENGSFQGINHIDWYVENAKPIIRQIVDLSDQGKLEIPMKNLLGSFVHMHFNRLFRTKQRMHELVVYYFMHKYYKSQAARLKYTKESTVPV